jgi:hypothetical protein
MSHFVLPVTQYALSGDVNIAYQTMGDGPLDLILVPGIISHVEFEAAIQDFVGKGLVADSGQRRWSERTGRYEIVWESKLFGKTLH